MYVSLDELVGQFDPCLRLLLTVGNRYNEQVHRNAFLTTMNLLKQNLCVEEFESNLATITHLSQQRHDSIYRADARKVLSCASPSIMSVSLLWSLTLVCDYYRSCS